MSVSLSARDRIGVGRFESLADSTRRTCELAVGRAEFDPTVAPPLSLRPLRSTSWAFLRSFDCCCSRARNGEARRDQRQRTGKLLSVVSSDRRRASEGDWRNARQQSASPSASPQAHRVRCVHCVCKQSRRVRGPFELSTLQRLDRSNVERGVDWNGGARAGTRQ